MQKNNDIGKCFRKNCKFPKHPDIRNNGGKFCCLFCKSNLKHGPGCTSKNMAAINKIKKGDDNLYDRIAALNQVNYSIGIGLVNIKEDIQNLPEHCVLHNSALENCVLAKNDCLEHLRTNDYIFIIQNEIPSNKEWWLSIIDNAILQGIHYSKQGNVQMFSKSCVSVCGGFNVDLADVEKEDLEYAKRTVVKKMNPYNESVVYSINRSMVYGLTKKSTYTITFFDNNTHSKKLIMQWASLKNSEKESCIIIHNGLELGNFEYITCIENFDRKWKFIEKFFLLNRCYLEGINIINFNNCIKTPTIERKETVKAHYVQTFNNPVYIYIPNQHVLPICAIADHLASYKNETPCDLAEYNPELLEIKPILLICSDETIEIDDKTCIIIKCVVGGELQYVNNVLTCPSKIDALVWIKENYQNSSGVCVCDPEKINIVDLIKTIHSHIFLPFWKLSYVDQWEACWISMNSLCCLMNNRDAILSMSFEQILEVAKKEFVIQFKIQSLKEHAVLKGVNTEAVIKEVVNTEVVNVEEEVVNTEVVNVEEEVAKKLVNDARVAKVYLHNLEQKTHYLLLYYNEDISQYTHPSITPIKLSEEYFLFFESRGFLQLDIANLPNVDNIGFITPSFFRKSGIETIDEITNITCKDNAITGFYVTNLSPTCLKEAAGCHGQNFMILWDYLLESLGLKKYIGKDFKCTYSNMWVCKRDIVINFIIFMRNVIKTMLSFSGKWETLVNSNSRYEGNAQHTIKRKAGFDYYTYHAFICERIIGLFCMIHQYDVLSFVNEKKLQLNKQKVLCIMACHTNSLIKINAVINNIKFFNETSDKIVIVDSLEFSKNETIIKNNFKNSDVLTFYHIQNDSLMCFSKYIHVLQNFDYTKYDKIILCNDSFIVIQSLECFKNKFLENVDLTTLLSSNEGHYHYTDYLRCYNKKSIKTILEYYLKNANNSNNFLQLIQTFEMTTAALFDKKNAAFETEKDYKHNINMHSDEKLQKYISNGYPIVKIKKLTSMVAPYINNALPVDFKAEEYKSLHADLVHFSEKDAETHFKHNGWKEGRVYKRNQPIVLPEYLQNALSRIGFEMN